MANLDGLQSFGLQAGRSQFASGQIILVGFYPDGVHLLHRGEPGYRYLIEKPVRTLIGDRIVSLQILSAPRLSRIRTTAAQSCYTDLEFLINLATLLHFREDDSAAGATRYPERFCGSLHKNKDTIQVKGGSPEYCYLTASLQVRMAFLADLLRLFQR